MATSGSIGVVVTSYNSLWFNWWQVSQSVERNETTINWNLKLTATSNGAIYSTATKSWWVNVNGNYYEGTNTIGINNNSEITLATGSTVIPHNTDGSKEFSFSFAQYFGITFGGKRIETIQGSGKDTLEPIARKANILTAPDFNDETASLTITYSNPLGNKAEQLQACIADGWNVLVGYKDIDKNGTSYTFNLTDAERKALRQNAATVNSKTLNFFVTTVIGGTAYYSFIGKTFSIINAEPTIAPTVIDVGEFSTALTGNNQTMIKYFNVMQATINAAAKKEATINKNYIKCGTNYVEADSYNFTYVDNNYFKFTTVDSRGNTVSKEITVPMVDYIPLTANIEADISLDTVDGTKANINFTISGNYFKGTFGAVENELIINYTVTDSDDNTSTYALTIPAEAYNKGTYEVTETISNLNYKNSYVVSFEIKDKIVTLNKTTKTLKAIPIFDWSETDFNFNVPIKVNNIELDYITEQGEKNGWQYRNWNSGKGECWKVITLNTSITTAWGNMYVGDSKMTRQNYPYPFKTKPVEIVNVACGSSAAWIFAESGGNGVNGAYASAIYNICRPTTAAAADYYIMLYACGELLN
jgi:hypothetical protein